jgi:integral membrane sensor domain MASE1
MPSLLSPRDDQAVSVAAAGALGGRRLRRVRESLPPRAAYALELLAVAGVYTGSGKLGLDLAFATHSVTAVWPPTGIALSALILGGYRLWPGVALGALLANLDTGVPAVTVFGITCGNTLEALAGAYLLRNFAGFRASFPHVRDVLALVALGAVLSTTVSATIGVASLLIGGATHFAHADSVWRTWWLGDMGGDLIVAPALLLAVTHRPFRRAPGGLLEALALAGSLGAVSALVFSQHTTVTYVVFPLMTWAALRFWQPGAAVASLIVASVAIAFTANGEGPFAASGPDDRLLLAQTFAAVAGMTALVLAVVTSARRRAEQAEHRIAQRLQRDLGPDPLPRIPGWDVAAFYQPAGAGVEVGGDFFDFFPTDDGWIVLLGDVTGKGVEAAAMTALMRHGARVATQLGEGPGVILARLDEALRQQPQLSLCTALCARLHDRDILISSAGHPPPLIVRDDGRIRELDGGGPLLGLAEGGDWPEHTLPVSRRETMLLYTDGVTDTRGEDERFGMRRLRELLAAHAGLSPATLLGELESALVNFQFGAQNDDTAALALRPSRPPATSRLRARPFSASRGSRARAAR